MVSAGLAEMDKMDSNRSGNLFLQKGKKQPLRLGSELKTATAS